MSGPVDTLVLFGFLPFSIPVQVIDLRCFVGEFGAGSDQVLVRFFGFLIFFPEIVVVVIWILGHSSVLDFQDVVTHCVDEVTVVAHYDECFLIVVDRVL